jgi:hypothetical protein
MLVRLFHIGALIAALAGCGQVHTASLTPNDPGYWYIEASRKDPQVRAPGIERTYRPLGGAVY